MTERPQSRGEEIANSLSHGLGFVAAIASAPILVVTTLHTGRAVNVIGAAIFAVTVVPHRRAKALLRKLDHGAIFLLIAGTYTPFMLGTLSGPRGWTLLGVVWSLAVVGVTLKAFDRIEHPFVSLGFYLLMGWLCVFALGPLLLPATLPRDDAVGPAVEGRRGDRERRGEPRAERVLVR